ncbi:hypothetical protein [Desulfoferrobacter suflitae]|uniref:hypothetical protein n=1 Tax=Desulfoferrobacter suflitae TaxID=2865782 RepID=UPI0021648A05|nr:hypothetical protein [Desulfoferrobacter suflitae]MCK8601803.1 hypothetical protein [Desulfoferrobacter suflitae]
MTKQLRIVSANGQEKPSRVLRPEQKFKHFRNVTGAVLQDAQDTWGELWEELQGAVVDGVLVLSDGKQGHQPKCGWPQFLEKMWILKHQLDYASRFCRETIG